MSLHLCTIFEMEWGLPKRESLMTAYSLHDAVVALCTVNVCYLRRKVKVIDITKVL